MTKKKSRFKEKIVLIIFLLIISGFVISIIWMSNNLIKPQFTIYKEECWNENIYNYENAECLSITCECAKNTTSPCMIYCFECKKDLFKTEQKCENVEVDEIELNNTG